MVINTFYHIYLLCLKNRKNIPIFHIWLTFGTHNVNSQGFRRVLVHTVKLESRSPGVFVSL